MVIEGALIGSGPGVAQVIDGDLVIDGEGGVLLPGLIDAHVHLHGRHSLEQLAGFGVTTALDMACAPPELVDALRGTPGLTDFPARAPPPSRQAARTRTSRSSAGAG